MNHYKDNFSKQSQAYALYRPIYPRALFDYLNDLVKTKHLAWDCATGNGQVASVLANDFEKVIATDASQAQIAQAMPMPNITYRVATAENAGLSDNSVDLITVAQALHWFDFDRFYPEVIRVAKPQAFLAVWSYGLARINPEVDEIIYELYANILGDTYWDAERKYIEEAYQTIPFPFEAFKTPSFTMQLEWDLAHTLGYLNTWSSIQKFIKANGFNPLDEVLEKIAKVWGKASDKKAIIWDLYLKIAQIEK